ncbi:amino acid permease [Erwinia sp. OLTSP20]|uniref:APC family permease n=1 Tax=unclassified Erwinia TaxID=2622719 RepID=UPI000C18E541|nr:MULTISPECIES: APC family permease [unclassified Erwinia]PIJ50080.1 amino acid permease [Erwinia sp. OAMSP11]PIJ71950.1 amino acid permease [Erwinia sp. OLSSP12]PIJ80932.1 amino acid permease [Erwinia sp. OLCASP19]PIJ83837.1 amino acid permease [Erwinia sp. OLMTSP26]PIJ85995.1 amino acid permease [Erwinia sp. OLMDSP33]
MDTQGSDKKLGVGSLALFSLCAVIVIDTLTASASIGVSAIGWWLVTFIIFVIPYGLITSELGTTYLGEGGIYDWVKKAFGYRWAVRTTWFYWVNVGLWMPAVYIMCAGMFANLFFPELPLLWIIVLCVALTWLTIWICNISVDVGVWVSNIGAILKVSVIGVLGVCGCIYAYNHGVANKFSFSAMLPSLDTGASFLPALVFNLMGFELVATMTKEMKNVNDMPKSIFLAAGITAFLYVFGTVGILMALPVDNISLVGGIIDTLHKLFGDSALGSAMVYLVGTMALLTFLGNMVTWTMGASRAAAEAAGEGELPAVFAKTSAKHGTPVGANMLTGIVSTLVIAAYALFAQDSDELFWSVFAFSSCIFLLPYLFMFPAFIKLRISDAATPRPFKVPGSKLVQWILSCICFLVILQAVVIFIFPELTKWQMDWAYSGPVLAGVVVTVLIGEILLHLAVMHKNQEGNSHTAYSQQKHI